MKMAIDGLKEAAAISFIAETGSPNNYFGGDMLSTHKGMNISALGFMAVMDTILTALKK